MTLPSNLERRDFLSAALATLPLALLAQSAKASDPPAVPPVRAGEDRFGEHHSIGISTTSFSAYGMELLGPPLAVK